VVVADDESEPFEVETDASQAAIAASLIGADVLLRFSCMLQKSELKHSSVERSPSYYCGSTSLKALFDRQAFYICGLTKSP